MKKRTLNTTLLAFLLPLVTLTCGPFDYGESNEFVCLGKWNSNLQTCDGECAEPYITCGGTCCQPSYCSDDLCCSPECEDKECGDNGCGGSCGTCLEGWQCSDDLCCSPDCEDKECGDNGCNGSCGTCPVGWQCGGDHRCFDPCEETECGDDGWGGSCGECTIGMTCQQGICWASVTWTDATSSLTWQLTPTGGKKTWSDAKAHCQGLSLDGGGWHLPTIGELRTLIQGCPTTQSGGSCNVDEGDCLVWSCRNDACDGCQDSGGPSESGMYWLDGVEGNCCLYWSSSPVEDAVSVAWGVDFAFGNVDSALLHNSLFVRCVR